MSQDASGPSGTADSGLVGRSSRGDSSEYRVGPAAAYVSHIAGPLILIESQSLPM